MELNEIVSGFTGSLDKAGGALANAHKFALRLACHARDHNDWTVFNKVIPALEMYDKGHGTGYKNSYLKWGERHFGLVSSDGLFITWAGADKIREGTSSARTNPFYQKVKVENVDVSYDLDEAIDNILKYVGVTLPKKIKKAELLGGDVDVNIPPETLEALKVIRGRVKAA